MYDIQDQGRKRKGEGGEEGQEKKKKRKSEIKRKNKKRMKKKKKEEEIGIASNETKIDKSKIDSNIYCERTYVL